mmetsp:Transcript_102806/g.193311  ORF Transcript_102806/g.193311 Transcript_102806/m.193311 type:complete len:138 (-) Transcript_102806:129-542(-)
MAEMNWFEYVTLWFGVVNVIVIFVSGIYGFVKKKNSASIFVAVVAGGIEIPLLCLLPLGKIGWVPLIVYSIVLFVMYAKKTKFVADQIAGEGYLSSLVEDEPADIHEIRETLHKLFCFLSIVNLLMILFSIISFFIQ